jgi:hypothetical protein
MSLSSPKPYQKEAVASALEIFRHAEGQLREVESPDDRLAISAHNGCILLEAPTGAGKTRMAGMIAEQFSNASHPLNARVVWFWFTPFAGLVEQTRDSLKSHFAGLRMRDLKSERALRDTRAGDCFVATWGAVAAKSKETRKVRQDGDIAISLDRYIPELREAGYRIGVVVDEAHHSFTKAREATVFFREVMRPDFTLMVTATPDDADVNRFKQAAGIAEVHRLRVSREDGVAAGLLKDGVKGIAFLAADDQKNLVDFADTALREGWRCHLSIREHLAEAGIDLVPLYLVQVGDSDAAVEDARRRLVAIGVPEERIAWYTAKDPNDDLLAVALDETKEVLIFKMAVALGFDAPRAFTLASLRSAKDANFGIQVVGRILRVHRRLQAATLNKTLPRALRHGYVILADADNQAGLVSAGERINAIRTELAEISPFTIITRVAGETQVQVASNGQTSLLPTPYRPSYPEDLPAGVNGGETLTTPPGNGYALPDLFGDIDDTPRVKEDAPDGKSVMPIPSGRQRYPIREDACRVFQAERMPLASDEILQCIRSTVDFGDQVLAAALRQNVKIRRKEVDVFSKVEELHEVKAQLDPRELAKRAQRRLFDAGCLDPRDLHEALMKGLAVEFDKRGYDDSPQSVERGLNLILASFPHLIRDVERKCAARHKETYEVAQWPESWEAQGEPEPSRLNVYGILPSDLNNPERAFARLLDEEMSDTVEYWYRNPPRAPWSVALVLPSGARYYPDFIVKVKGRTRGDGFLLVEIKGTHILNSDDTLEKVLAEHKTYGRPLMLNQDKNGRFMTVSYFEKSNRCEEDQVFRVENMAGY